MKPCCLPVASATGFRDLPAVVIRFCGEERSTLRAVNRAAAVALVASASSSQPVPRLRRATVKLEDGGPILFGQRASARTARSSSS